MQKSLDYEDIKYIELPEEFWWLGFLLLTNKTLYVNTNYRCNTK